MNVDFDKNCSGLLPYKIMLEKGVHPILNRIEHDFSMVKWIIYDNKNPPSEVATWANKGMIRPFIYKSDGIIADILAEKYDKAYYACTDYEKGIIYISTTTIRLYQESPLPAHMPFPKQHSQKLSQFACIIIDELTHIATKSNHGTQIYNDTFLAYAAKCFGL